MSSLFGEIDLYLAGEGRHERLYEVLGAHVRESGVSFAVWAPNARAVAVVGDFNDWQPTPMQNLGESGIWEGVVDGAETEQRYKFQVVQADGTVKLKVDPLAFAAEVPAAHGVDRPQQRAQVEGRRMAEAPPPSGNPTLLRSRSTRYISARGGGTRWRTTAR